MRKRQRRILGWVLLAAGCVLASGATARAEEPPPWHPWRLRQWPGRAYQGRNNREHTFERAGHPEEVSRFAHESDTPRYYGYYVGGGVLKGGSSLGPTQGTWGWDYGGLFQCLPAKIELLWNPARYQSGEGHYKIDGPPVKDVGPYVDKIKEAPKAFHEIRAAKE